MGQMDIYNNLIWEATCFTPISHLTLATPTVILELLWMEWYSEYLVCAPETAILNFGSTNAIDIYLVEAVTQARTSCNLIE